MQLVISPEAADWPTALLKSGRVATAPWGLPTWRQVVERITPISWHVDRLRKVVVVKRFIGQIDDPEWMWESIVNAQRSLDNDFAELLGEAIVEAP